MAQSKLNCIFCALAAMGLTALTISQSNGQENTEPQAFDLAQCEDAVEELKPSRPPETWCGYVQLRESDYKFFEQLFYGLGQSPEEALSAVENKLYSLRNPVNVSEITVKDGQKLDLPEGKCLAVKQNAEMFSMEKFPFLPDAVSSIRAMEQASFSQRDIDEPEKAEESGGLRVFTVKETYYSDIETLRAAYEDAINMPGPASSYMPLIKNGTVVGCAVTVGELSGLTGGFRALNEEMAIRQLETWKALHNALPKGPDVPL